MEDTPLAQIRPGEEVVIDRPCDLALPGGRGKYTATEKDFGTYKVLGSGRLVRKTDGRVIDLTSPEGPKVHAGLMAPPIAPDARPDVQAPHLMEPVLYCQGDKPPRGALVGHVHPNDLVVDLVVILDGYPELPQTRDTWARGFQVAQCRLDIPHKSLDPAGVRHWKRRGE